MINQYNSELMGRKSRAERRERRRKNLKKLRKALPFVFAPMTTAAIRIAKKRKAARQAAAQEEQQQSQEDQPQEQAQEQQQEPVQDQQNQEEQQEVSPDEDQEPETQDGDYFGAAPKKKKDSVKKVAVKPVQEVKKQELLSVKNIAIFGGAGVLLWYFTKDKK